MLSLISFTGYMGVLSLIRGFKNLNDLNHVKGKVTDFRFVKHEYQSRRKTKFKNVLVLAIDGSSDELGFVESSKDPYKSLWKILKPGDIAEIYYDSTRRRIEENVTLHTFDLNINNFHLIHIDDIKKKERIVSFVCFSACLIILIITYKVLIRIRNRNLTGSN